MNNVFVIFISFFFIPLRSRCFHLGRRGPLVGDGTVGWKDAYPSYLQVDRARAREKKKSELGPMINKMPLTHFQSSN